MTAALISLEELSTPHCSTCSVLKMPRESTGASNKILGLLIAKSMFFHGMFCLTLLSQESNEILSVRQMGVNQALTSSA